jgi:subtilisin family serine protease
LKWYTVASGTSISAACVSGVAALVKSIYPGDSGVLLKRRILEGVEVKTSLRTWDGQQTVIRDGRLSAVGALTTQLNITPPTLQEVNYKTNKQKLFVYGFGMQAGVTVLVGNAAFPGRPQSDDGTAFMAKVPVTAFPPGAPVQVKLRNPDGGESRAITLTR